MISACSLATMSRGVPAGAITPSVVAMSNSGNPISLTVGMSGKFGARLAVLIPSMRSLPALKPTCAPA